MFSSLKTPRPVWCPPSLLFSGYRVSLPGVKRPGRYAHHSGAEVKNDWSYTSAPARFPHGVEWDILTLLYRHVIREGRSDDSDHITCTLLDWLWLAWRQDDGVDFAISVGELCRVYRRFENSNKCYASDW